MITTLDVTEDLTWRSSAACKGLDATAFYPGEEDEEQTALAKSICANCLVQERCLEWALGTREKDGVWGGATERERRRIIRQRRRRKAS